MSSGSASSLGSTGVAHWIMAVVIVWKATSVGVPVMVETSSKCFARQGPARASFVAGSYPIKHRVQVT